MAIRLASPKILKSIRYYTRPLNSAVSSSLSAVSPINFSEKPDPEIPKPASSPAPSPASSASIINLDDGEKIFASVSATKLLRSALNLHAAAIEPMVDVGTWVMRSRLMETPLLKDVILGAIKHTFYEHFCAGENTEEVGRTLARLNDAGLKGMLVYALEHAHDNVSCDRNLDAFIKSAELTQQLPPASVSSVIVKISAICPTNLLKRVSDLLRWEHKDSSFHLNWKMDSFPLLSDSSPMYHTLNKPEHLTPEEENDLRLAHLRLQKLCQKCVEVNVPLLVDAEDTAVQPAIDYLTYASAIMYNKDQHPIVFNTMQAYLKDAKDRLQLAMTAAEKMGVPLGIKLVRGAYMSSERNLASSLGYESPIHNTIEDTHNCYNACASYMLEKIAASSASLVIATHNVESGKLAAAKARDLGLGKKNQRLEFGQLYGMSEALSFSLNNAGFQVSKYMPYGPVEMVMPYLLRRAEENRGLLSTSSLDRDLMKKELKRRLKSAIFNTNDAPLEQGQV